MAAESKFIKTKSNYVLRGKHQTIDGGTIFERDFMTISGLDGMSPDEDQVYGSSNFKFVVRTGVNQQKKHTNGRWILDSEVLTGETSNIISRDSKIVFNPDYQSITDFAYYGSAVELVKATVINIILKFPAELYFTNESVTIDGGTYYKVSNDFGIDVITENVKEEEVDNIIRYLAISYNQYNVWSPTQAVQACTGAIKITHLNKDCNDTSGGAFIANVDVSLGAGGEVKIFVYKIGEEIYLYHQKPSVAGYSLRPNNEIIEKFYDELDDFSKVLLDRDSRPRYTAVFNSPYEAKNGYFTYRRKYTWPSTYGWNPDLNSMAYATYLGSLIRLATFHDEYDSDNIWRSMTHEAIKNLDWTFTKVQGEDVDEMDTIDNSKVVPVLRIYGRMYDDIKRTIDVISRSTNVTYDKKNNIPDYFLDDTLSLAGWETRAVNPTTDNNVVTPALYSGVTMGYNSIDANDEFMRRLKINSPYILSMKGTAKGVAALLGLFGFEKDKDYNMSEYVVVASGTLSYDEIAEHNKNKGNFIGVDGDPLYGLPLRGIQSGDLRYAIPWYEDGKKYDDGTYFQMKGGWGKMEEKMVDLPELIGPDTKFIHSNTAYTIYDETISDMKFAQSIEDMLELGRTVVKTGDVCYVTNITSLNEKYNQKPMEPVNIEDASHYFILVNDDFADKLGYVELDNEELSYDKEAYGWKSVSNTDIRLGESQEALRILHLESIVDDTTGNNPHMGHGMYDSGQSYIDNMVKPFGPTFKNNNFFMYDDVCAETVTNTYAFTPTEAEDNKKCWFFTDDKCYSERPSTDNEHLGETTPKTTAETDWNSSSSMARPVIGITTYNPESGATNEEAAANSVINVKKFVINFHPDGFDDGGASELHDFITNKVLFYLKQIIPSTALFEYTIGGSSGSVANNVNN